MAARPDPRPREHHARFAMVDPSRLESWLDRSGIAGREAEGLILTEAVTVEEGGAGQRKDVRAPSPSEPQSGTGSVTGAVAGSTIASTTMPATVALA